MEYYPVVTIDGPGSSGKSTLCIAIAKKLKWNLLDSGAIYRALASSILSKKININSEKEISYIAKKININFKIYKNKIEVFFKNTNITKKINDQKISYVASKIAKFPLVREVLISNQRSFRKSPGLIANGRDMGTVVFTDAFIKIFLNASLKVRAQRRLIQLKKNGVNKINIDKVVHQLNIRDERDRNRIISPLKPAQDAIILDTTDLSINDIVEKILKYIKTRLKK